LSRGALPERLSELTPAWLTGVMRASGALRVASVSSLEFERIGVFSNDVWRVRVGYDGPETDAPRSLVLKRPKPGGHEKHGTGYGNEIAFYRGVGGGLGVRAPRLVFGEHDPASGRAMLLIEEVEGLRPVSFMRGVDDAHADAALGALGSLHRRWWGGADELDALPSLADPGFRSRISEAYDRGWAASRDWFTRQGHGDFVEIGDALVGRAAASIAPLGAPATLLHGDAHFENLPLDTEDEVVFLDWAAARRGLASFDVAVFMVQSFVPEQRAAQERRRVEAHAEAASDGWTDPWLDYRRAVLFWMTHMLQDAEISEGWVVIDRYVAAAVHLKVGELIV
jgi:aminoglycoside phosphotransferase (APT) family kinase protein